MTHLCQFNLTVNFGPRGLSEFSSVGRALDFCVFFLIVQRPPVRNAQRAGLFYSTKSAGAGPPAKTAIRDRVGRARTVQWGTRRDGAGSTREKRDMTGHGTRTGDETGLKPGLNGGRDGAGRNGME